MSGHRGLLFLFYNHTDVPIFYYDFTVLSSQGIAGGSGAGTAFETTTGFLRFTRGSEGTRYPTTNSITIESADHARISKWYNGDAKSGLLFEPSRKNAWGGRSYILNGVGEEGTGIETANFTAGPDGTVVATRVNLGSGKYSRYIQANGGGNSPNPSIVMQVFGYWVKATSGTAKTQSIGDRLDPYLCKGINTDSTWRRLIYKCYWPCSTNGQFIVEDSLDLSAGDFIKGMEGLPSDPGLTGGPMDNCIDFVQAQTYPSGGETRCITSDITPDNANLRAADTLFVSSTVYPSTIISGRVSAYVTIQRALCNFEDHDILASAQMYIIQGFTGSGNWYLRIDPESGAVQAHSQAGTTFTSPGSITWDEGDTIEFYFAMGGGLPTKILYSRTRVGSIIPDTTIDFSVGAPVQADVPPSGTSINYFQESIIFGLVGKIGYYKPGAGPDFVHGTVVPATIISPQILPHTGLLIAGSMALPTKAPNAGGPSAGINLNGRRIHQNAIVAIDGTPTGGFTTTWFNHELMQASHADVPPVSIYFGGGALTVGAIYDSGPHSDVNLGAHGVTGAIGDIIRLGPGSFGQFNHYVITVISPNVLGTACMYIGDSNSGINYVQGDLWKSTILNGHWADLTITNPDGGIATSSGTVFMPGQARGTRIAIDGFTLLNYNLDEAATGPYANTGTAGVLNLSVVPGGGATITRVNGQHAATLCLRTVALGGFVGGAGTGNGTACIASSNTSLGETSGTTFTCHFWVKANTWVEQATIVDKAYRNDHSWANPYVTTAVECHSNGQISFYFTIAGTIFELRTSTIISVGVFHHYMATYDGSSANVYVDGALAGTLVQAGSLDWGTHGPWIVGGNPNGTIEQRFDGTIQDIRIENTVRNGSFALSVYNSG